MNMHAVRFKIIHTILAFGIIALMFAYFFYGPRAQSSDSNFADGITVNSKLDTADINIGDSICDDGSGNCTFRAAIEESNITAGTQTIRFNITGAEDFTISGEKGYTIKPSSPLPDVTDAAIINGYTQPGSRANTAISPRPLNGILLIELDGENMNGLDIYADSSVLRGLVINNNNSAGIRAGGDNIIIAGNYIGTDPAGQSAVQNTQNGINAGGEGYDDPDNLTIGGYNPADRNIISGNGQSGITPNTGDDYWKIIGNYIGVAANGTSPLPNSYANGPGALSLDNSNGHIIGGAESGASNVISGNRSFAIFPDNTVGTRIQGNIIGPRWDGSTLIGSLQPGGIGLPPVNGPIQNMLIGGDSVGAGNLIAHNNGPGISVLDMYSGGTLLYSSQSISIIGNSIYNNNASSLSLLSGSGLGIDIAEADLSSFTITGIGTTPNDASDVDLGPNLIMNFPVLNSVVQNGTTATVNLSLDAANTTNSEGLYRIELFANDNADNSGYGEGQIYLGYAMVANGTNKNANFNLPTGINLSGKKISATTTAMNNSSIFGFGATSEFSQTTSNVQVVNYSASTNNNNVALVSTGQDIRIYYALAVTFVLLAGVASIINVRGYSGISYFKYKKGTKNK
jgi:hypothetical protein